MESWGFEYKSNLVQAKRHKDGGPDGRGVGFYCRNVTERSSPPTANASTCTKRSATSPPTTNMTATATPSAQPAPTACEPPTNNAEPGTATSDETPNYTHQP